MPAAAMDRWLERLLVFVLAASAAGLALALSGRFSAWPMLGTGAIAAAAWAWRFRQAPATEGPALQWRHAWPILLLALLLRLPPADIVQGGQDPGVYANVAAHIARTGGIVVGDPVFDRLQGSAAMAQYRADNYTDPFLPGLYTLGDARPPLVFQFYPLLPTWMAASAQVFGPTRAGGAMLLFALLSVLCFQRLALQLGGSPRAAAAAALLLATNPLHALFSTLPLTEVPTLGFSTAGFCLLAMYAASPARPRRWLLLSALCFTALFLTRISGFMYLPIVLAIGAGAWLLDADRARARDLQAWSLAVVAAYALSVAYGLTWSAPYSRKIYGDAFVPLAGVAWPTRFALAGVLVAAAWAVLWRWPSGRLARALRAAVAPAERLLGPLLCALVLLALWKGWRLGFGTLDAGGSALQYFPGLVGAGWMSLAHLSVSVLAMYLGPFALLALLVVGFGRWPAGGRLLLLFVACFLAYAALLNWVLPYQPYYGRYLLSELLPYALLMLCCALAWTRGRAPRAALGIVLLLSLAGNGLLLARQAGPPENAGARQSIAALAERLGAGDLLLLDGYHVPGFEPKEVKTPLVFMFGKQVATVGHGAMSDVGYLRQLQSRFGRVLLATTDDHAPPGFRRIGRHPLRSFGFEHSPWPAGPRTRTLDVLLHLYEMDAVPWTAGRRSSFQWPDRTARTDVGRISPRRLAARGEAGLLLSRREAGLPAGHYRLLLRGWDDGRQDASVSLRDGEGRVLAQAPLAARRSPAGMLASLDLDLDRPLDALEVRVDVGRGSTVAIRAYTLTRLR
jgi:hypothetical protein